MKTSLSICLILFLSLVGCRLPAELSPDPASPPTPTPKNLPPTPQVMCTPPPCSVDEAYHCPDVCPGGCGTVCATHTPGPAVPNYVPVPGNTFHIQYQGQLDLDINVDIYNLDLFDTTREQIQELHGRGVAVICYFSAGSYEDWRPDAGAFPKAVLGEPLDDWPGESWLDIRQIDLLGPIMVPRLTIALAKGCDAVDPDNLDGFANDTGFPLTSEDQLAYNRWLARQAHQRGLAIGLKNDLEQIPDLVADFDFAVNEECYTYQECGLLLPFIQHGKAVFGIEYQSDRADFCPQASQDGFSFVLKNIELDAWSQPCWED